MVAVPDPLHSCHDEPQDDPKEQDQENPTHIKETQLVHAATALGIVSLK